MSVFQLVSEPLHCVDCALFSFVLQVPAVISNGLNEHFLHYYIFFVDYVIFCSVHINKIIAIKYHLHLGKHAHCFLL